MKYQIAKIEELQKFADGLRPYIQVSNAVLEEIWKESGGAIAPPCEGCNEKKRTIQDLTNRLMAIGNILAIRGRGHLTYSQAVHDIAKVVPTFATVDPENATFGRKARQK